MASRRMNQTKPPPAEPLVAVESLGLDGFIEPDDQGLSLNELSQAYAALLAQGSDPYPQGTDSAPSNEPSVLTQAESEPATAEKEAEPPFEVTPRSILEAILFVGHPSGESLTS